MLELDDIHTYYGDSHVLQGVSLAVEPGFVTALLGRNGVGKTTLTRSVMGFTPPRRGHVRLGDVDLARWPAHRIARAGIALVPQGRRIFPSLTVEEHLTIAPRAPRRGLSAWSLDRVRSQFPRLGERWATRAGHLSGGERQMLAIARALVANPAYVVMDEPTEGLSPPMVAEVASLIRQLAGEGVGVLLVEQNLGFALEVAHQVHIMEKGRCVWQGTPRALADAPSVRQQFLGV